jgi:hypothetical protein
MSVASLPNLLRFRARRQQPRRQCRRRTGLRPATTQVRELSAVEVCSEA